jgi:hypothetical protein
MLAPRWCHKPSPEHSKIARTQSAVRISHFNFFVHFFLNATESFQASPKSFTVSPRPKPSPGPCVQRRATLSQVPPWSTGAFAQSPSIALRFPTFARSALSHSSFTDRESSQMSAKKEGAAMCYSLQINDL